MDPSSTKTANASAELLVIALSPVVFITGLLGNLTTILVLFKNKKYSTSIYLILLAFADLGLTTIVFPRWFFIYAFRLDIRTLSDFSCKVHVFITYFSGRLSNSCLVALTIERMISTVKPHHFNRMCNRRKATAVCFAIVLFLIFAHLHVFYGFSVRNKKTTVNTDTAMYISEYTSDNQIGNVTLKQKDSMANQSLTTSITEPASSTPRSRLTTVSTYLGTPDNTSSMYSPNGVNATVHSNSSSELYCTWEPNSSYGYFFTEIYEKIATLFFFYMADSIFIIGFFVIIRKLRQAKKNMKQDDQTMLAKQSVRITITLLVVNFTFLILTIPFLTFVIGRHIWVDPVKGMTGIQKLLWSIFLIMYSANYAVNFLLYFCTGEKFRRQVREFYSSCWPSRRVAPTQLFFRSSKSANSSTTIKKLSSVPGPFDLTQSAIS